MTDQQFEDASVVVGTVPLQAMLLACGTYLIVTEHYGWAWIPFLCICGAFRRSKPNE